MPHQIYRATITLHTALGTPMAGDTLFGQMCWLISEHFGQERLTQLLEGYIDGNPYMVVSDAMPHGFIPLPTLPSYLWGGQDAEQRKQAKAKIWLSLTERAQAKSLSEWKQHAQDDARAYGHKPQQRIQMHNTINRATGTTGEGAFAPYQMSQIWFAPETQMDLYIVLDTERIGSDEIQTLLIAMGKMGYGRDASIGLGKFSVTEIAEHDWSESAHKNLNPTQAYMTLAPSAPQGQAFDEKHSYYQPMTRFGRHGNRSAVAGHPFKNPILMANTGAYFTQQSADEIPRTFIGQGIGNVSAIQAAAIHQGYAPVLPMQSLTAPSA